MTDSHQRIVELYESLLVYKRTDAYTDVLAPWLSNNSTEAQWIEDFYRRTNDHWAAATDDDLVHLYALSRATSLLLLRFQTGRADGTDYQGPIINVKDVQRFHEQLGFTTIDNDDFHPFFHEILTVIPAEDASAPPQLADYEWPCLMLGNMQFHRAGVTVIAGANHIQKDIAESSKIYWTYRRKNRPCHDLSYGWGRNSQWGTNFRRDYRTKNQYHFNIDGRFSLNDPNCILEETSRALMIELVRNRCRVRRSVCQEDPFPYDCSYIETIHSTL